MARDDPSVAPASRVELDAAVTAALHAFDSESPAGTASSPPPPAPSTARPSSHSAAAVRPPSSSRSAAAESLAGRQLRSECLRGLLSALHAGGLLSSYQRSVLDCALSIYAPRYLAVVDAWLQCERSHQLSLRAALRQSAAVTVGSTHTAADSAISASRSNSASSVEAVAPISPSASDAALPAPPTSLLHPSTAPRRHAPSGCADGRETRSLPLSDLLSSGVSSTAHSASVLLSHLLTTALLGSLEEAWLAACLSYSTAEARRLSKAERLRLELTGSAELVYGEVTLPSLARILWALPGLSPGGRFVDLGSGTGRAVIGALLLHDWEEVRGIELLDGLYRASERVREKVERDKGGVGGVSVLQHYYQAQYAHSSSQLGDDESGGHTQRLDRPARIVLQHGSFLDADWSDADVVLANSVCFSEPTMTRLAEQAFQLKPGAFCHSQCTQRACTRSRTERRTPSLLM